jgi:hypothetical protein
MCCDVAGNNASRTTAIIDDDLLTERFTELLAERARHDVGRPAGRKRQDQAQGVIGIDCASRLCTTCTEGNRA